MKNFVLWAVIAVAVLVLFSQFMPRVGQAEEVRYSTFLDEVRNGRVEQVVLQGEQILGTRKDKTVFRVYNPETDYTALIGDPSDPSNNGYARYGARPTMIIMTDGQTNQGPGNWSLPSGWDWSDWTDYDDDGDSDYSTSDKKKQYAFWEATEAIQQGVTIHTMSVGVDADRDLMEAIAFAGNGVWMNVPGGTTVAQMESELMDAFRQIAAKVPPAKLIYGTTN